MSARSTTSVFACGMSRPDSMILVDDDQAELIRDDVAGEDAMRSDQDVDLALAELAEHALHLRRRPEARDHLHANREVAVALAERVPVLLRKHRRRDEH